MASSIVRLFVLSLAICASFLSFAQQASAQETCGPTVVVAPGDNLFRIAQRCGITVDALRAANPQVTDPSRLFVGTVLTIPTSQVPITPGVVAIFPAGGPPGAVVTVVANGLPANSPVTVGFGPMGAQPIITSGATSGAYGELQAQTNLPPNVTAGGAPWVVTLTINGQAAGTSMPYTITNAPAPGPGPTPPPSRCPRSSCTCALHETQACRRPHAAPSPPMSASPQPLWRRSRSRIRSVTPQPWSP